MIDVQIIGLDRLRAWLLTAEARFDAALERATAEGTEITADAIRADTPVLSGHLVGSVQAVVERGPLGVEGRVGTMTDYAPFVENGTHQHGAAQHMFQHGAEETQPEVEGRFRNAVHEIAASFGNI